MDSISFLLGAGFSTPMGYPSGKQLNKYLLDCTGDEFSFHSIGSLVASDEGKKPDFGYKTSYDTEFEFCKEVIKYYDAKFGFDYEEFYDFIMSDAKNDLQIIEIAKPFLNMNTHQTSDSLVYRLDNILNQLIEYYLKDSDGKAWYDNEPHIGHPYFPKYTGFLNLIENRLNDFVIDIHTLNHDLFFERLNNTDWINGQLCDGFEELGSPYYGELNINQRLYKVRLERYIGSYEKRVRLFKLHGSRDYVIYYENKGSAAYQDKYLKMRYGVGAANLFKEVEEDGKTIYKNCWINYHADFLTGTTTKIERYAEPLLYKTLFDKFRTNLTNSKCLVIIGYGGRDSEINKMIYENFDWGSKKAFIVDPFPSVEVLELKEKISGILIQKSVSDIEIGDFNQ